MGPHCSTSSGIANSQNIEGAQIEIYLYMTTVGSSGAVVWGFATSQSFNENGVKFVCLSYQSSFSWRLSHLTIA